MPRIRTPAPTVRYFSARLGAYKERTRRQGSTLHVTCLSSLLGRRVTYWAGAPFFYPCVFRLPYPGPFSLSPGPFPYCERNEAAGIMPLSS
jgi:hypothetical protein